MLVDIHTHIIPGVDDGCKEDQEVLSMLEQAIDQGIDVMIATPHFIHGRHECVWKDIKPQYERVLSLIEKNDLPIKVVMGNEIMFSDVIDYTKLLNSGDLLTMNGTNYVLMEFSYHHRPSNFDDVVYDLSLSGYKLIVAHPERYTWLNKKDMTYLKSEGALFQINVGAFINEEGPLCKKKAKYMLKHGFCDYIASDQHIFRDNHLGEVSKIIRKAKNKSKINDFTRLGL